MDSLRGTREAGKDSLDSLRGTREAGKDPSDSQRGIGLPIESRFWKGAGFCITFNTISMAIGPVRGKSWGGLHGWLPVAQLARHQGGRKGSIGQPAEAPGRHQEGRKEPFGQLGRHQGGRKESIGKPARHQRGTREAGKNHHQGGTRETRRTGLPIKSRFWKGAGFCITFNTISMAIGPVCGKSWGGPHGRLPVAQNCL